MKAWQCRSSPDPVEKRLFLSSAIPVPTIWMKVAVRAYSTKCGSFVSKLNQVHLCQIRVVKAVEGELVSTD